MKITMLLADSAQEVNGKLYILGGGWSVTPPIPVPSAIALKIEVPWDQANRRKTLSLRLLDEDGHPVQIQTPAGHQELRIDAEFEVGRPPGMKPGTPLDMVTAVQVPPLLLPGGKTYVWRLAIDGEENELWASTFFVRAM